MDEAPVSNRREYARHRSQDLVRLHRCVLRYKFGEHEFHGIGFVFTADDPSAASTWTTPTMTSATCPRMSTAPSGRPMTPEPEKIIQGLGSYYEISPSGRGTKMIVKAEAPHCGKRGCFEVYDHARYFTITGQCPEQCCPYAPPRRRGAALRAVLPFRGRAAPPAPGAATAATRRRWRPQRRSGCCEWLTRATGGEQMRRAVRWQLGGRLQQPE